MSDPNGNVKWKHLLGVITLSMAAIYAYTVSGAEFAQFEKNLDKNMVRIDATMLRIFEEIKTLKK